MIKELFSKENYKTLFKAIKTESPMRIFKNIIAKLSSSGNTYKPDNITNNSNILRLIEGEENGYLLNIDFNFLFKDAIYIRGWFIPLDINQIVTILIDGKEYNVTKSGKLRPDVFHAYQSFEDQAKYSGFHFFNPLGKKPLQMAHIQVKTDDRILAKYHINLVKHKSFNHIHLPRYEQYNILLDLIPEHKKRSFNFEPLISIVVPTYNTDVDLLDELVESVLAQTYENWQLCFHDDRSPSEETIEKLEEISKSDKRIKVSFGQKNQNISGATNDAIKNADGEYIAFLDHDDTITPNALASYVNKLNENPKIDFFYSDEDKINQDGSFCEPYFKQDFSPDLLRSNNYICHFVMVSKALGDKVGWLRLGFEGAQDHDFVFRATEQANEIYHHPEVLYHWRKVEGSTALSHGEKGYAKRVGLKSVKEHLKRIGANATASNGLWPGSYKINYHIDESKKITIIIPFKDDIETLKVCINSIISKTEYDNYELLLISNNSKEEKTIKYLDKISDQFDFIRYVEYNVPFNYSKINNYGVSLSDADYILLLNNDTEVINHGWLNEMAMHIQRDEVGAIGAKLLYPDGTIQHAGVSLGIGGVAGHAMKGLPGHQHHYFMDSIVRNISACTAACLLVKKSVFNEVGGLNETDLKVAFNDIDFCLKVGKAGYDVLYTPFAELKHYESKSRGHEDTKEKIKRFESETDYMKKSWKEVLENDPYYNPNLSRKREDYSLSLNYSFDEN